ncbi:MAG: L-histidine N(alpha)-methyltransferase [Nanoarchaeota archaeon]
MIKLGKPKPAKINDLIFKELIKRGYSLEGKTKVWDIADSKLWYLIPDQAQAFLDLEQSEGYQKNVIQKEIDLINKNIDVIFKKIGNQPLNIIDLGCGDGKKAVIFINMLKTKVKLRYCPVDISSFMVDKAIETLKQSMKRETDIVKFQWNISDFENLENVAASLRQNCPMGDCFKKNFVLLLGNTLGNFEINGLLYEISNSLQEGDFLLIGNGLDNGNSEDKLKSYKDQIINDWLVKVLTQIGLRKEDIQYNVRFKNSRIEEYYALLNDVEISFLGRKLSFERGDQIIVAVSYQYKEDLLYKFVKMYFKDVKMFTTPDNSYSLLLCKK